jgi:hypothetical protein
VLWDDPGEDVGVEAVKLPDISVGRSRYCHAEWVRFDVVNGRYFEDWGVVAVEVQEIPAEHWVEGSCQFTFSAQHAPLDEDYAHSEIRAYEQGQHINAIERMPEEVHLVWREKLLRKLRTVIKPFQKVRIRQNPPTSHKLEPHIVEA